MGKFEQIIPFILKHEGGYIHDPDDPGGETKYGISKRAYPHEDIKNLTIERAIELYRRDYWDPYPYERIEDERLTAKVFDISVNVGSWRSTKILQQSLNNIHGKSVVVVDGYFGPLTLYAINKTSPQKLYGVFLLEMEKYYKSLNKPKYIKGWLNRLYEELTVEAQKMAHH